VRTLVTGITGFAGSHLAERLLASGHEVHGLVRPGAPVDNLAAIRDRLSLSEEPLSPAPLARVFREVRPELVFHLAGQAHVAQAWRDRHDTFESNVLGTVAVLGAAAGCETGPRVLLVSSGEVYGGRGAPFAEDAPRCPETPYALSKAMAEDVALAHGRWDGLPVVVARPFNHTGPRQAPTFVCSELAHQVAEIRLGKRPPRLAVGNLAARRDFSDVRDTVRGYEILATRGQPGRIYNLCSGRGVAIQEVLDTLLSLAGRPVDVVVDPVKFRPLDNPEIVGDGARAERELGYHAGIPLATTLADLVAYWTELLA
jgi:GDP-4-dehydro-6-deoxy-D-mannose reductase